MWNPISIDEDEVNQSSSVDQDELMANINAYNNRLNKWLNLAAASERQQNTISNNNIYDYDGDDFPSPYLISNEYYLRKRRGGLEEPNNHSNMRKSHNPDLFRNINSIVHIRQNIDPTTKITPSSSMKSSDFIKLTKFDDSEPSSEKNL